MILVPPQKSEITVWGTPFFLMRNIWCNSRMLAITNNNLDDPWFC